MKSRILLLILVSLTMGTTAQEAADTNSLQLGEIVIRVLEQNQKLLNTPAAVITISQKQLIRFNNTALVAAINTQPGVRMEERSPGSYRLNIRGSSLRAPFGVRNVKVYLNGIPFTEPGGSTYLNLLSFFNVQSIEILKGPAGSLYGAGNGGAVLLRTQSDQVPAGIGIDYTTGSYGLQQLNLFARAASNQQQQTIGYTRLHSDGYRDWTKLDRSVFTWDGRFKLSNRNSLRSFVMYADLRYQTPGGLTAAEFAANPRQARPGVGALPGSSQARAGVNQKNFLSGLSHDLTITPTLKNTTSVYGAFSQFNNPTVRNFERRLEPHLGGRTVFTFNPGVNKGDLQVIAGAEMQTGWYNIRVYRNRNGVSDSLQTEDDVTTNLWSAFVQADYKPSDKWSITIGASLNRNQIRVTRLTQFPINTQQRTYSNELAPRLAVLRKLNNNVAIYASVAKGFSPPTSAEVLPSTGIISTQLNAETGWNYELGTRMNLLQGKLFADFNAFYLRLSNAIVQRRDAGGADFFINAGSTNQQGVEALVNYKASRQLTVWTSYTFHNFRYQNFKQLNNDFSGKQLPGVPRRNCVIGVDVTLQRGLYANATFNYVSQVPLNDANTFSAAAYALCNMRLGYRRSFLNTTWDFFAAADNLLNETYSLGNDINAAGNRFFNVAPGRNFSAGVSVFFQRRQPKPQTQ